MKHDFDRLCTLCGKDSHDEYVSYEDENQVKRYVVVHTSNFSDLEQIYDKENDFVDKLTLVYSSVSACPTV